MDEQSLTTIEAFAQYMRGAVTLFFIFWSFMLFTHKRRNRMMQLLFYNTVSLAFGYLKDAVFLFAEWKNSMFLNDVVRLIDLFYIPLGCSFFFEAVSPGLITKKRFIILLALQSLFVVAFAIYPEVAIVHAAISVDFILSIITLVYVLIFAAKHHKFITDNFSSIRHIDVNWVAVSCFVYVSSLFLYAFAFEQTTWLSESLFNLFAIIFWTFLFLYARRHRLVRKFMPEETVETQLSDGNEENKANIEGETALTQAITERNDLIAMRLQQIMEGNKVYLNPVVSLGDVAQAIGTNKTYLSDYINNILNTTFYDYINTYRVAEACRIIEAMPSDGRKPMSVVAELSGFNSLSSFNRYFSKVMKMSPKSYYSSKAVSI